MPEWWEMIAGVLTLAFAAWAFVVRQIGNRVSNAVDTAFKALSAKIDGVDDNVRHVDKDVRHLQTSFSDYRVDVESRIARLEENSRSTNQNR